jgi:cephalosporin hydroxylase/glycosyltransferase involved in cell wall biosynthesis
MSGVIDQFHTWFYRAGCWKKTHWLGVPCLKCPFDLWVYQQILFDLRPALIVETGTYRGGTSLYLASLCDMLNFGEVVSVDISPRKVRPKHERLTYLNGSSTSEDVVKDITRRAQAASGPVLFVLDSDHSEAHVARELICYAPLVTPGSYLIVEDSNVNGHPVLPTYGAGPWEAVQRFVSEHPEFIHDESRVPFGVTFHPGAYLLRTRDGERTSSLLSRHAQESGPVSVPPLRAVRGDRSATPGPPTAPASSMKRTELLNHLVARKSYRSYLEIGCNRDGTFRDVATTHKVGVDPMRGGTVRMTSDEFFAGNRDSFDLVFVDGLHRREQVLRDVENAVCCLSPGGCVVIHDCLPQQREQQLREPPGGKMPWTGDVWKAVVDLRQRAEFDIAVLDSDWGLGVLFVRPNTDRLEVQAELDWEDFLAGRDRLLRVVDAEGIRRFIDVGGEGIRGGAYSQASGAALAPRLFGESTLHRGADTAPVAEGARSAGRLTVALAHSNLGQFRHLHEYLNQSGLATSYLFCSEANFRKHGRSIPNLVPFKPHGGKLSDPQSFYYLSRVEGANRRSLGLAKAICQLQKRTSIDVFIGHITAGSPSMMFGEFEFPIVTYLEYPSFQRHGWDARYPPPDIKQLRDKNFEMLTAQAVLQSHRAIVPSAYARSLFAAELQSKITVLMEGFPLEREGWSQGGILRKEDGVQYVGFAARDLSSAKGFDQFVRIANRVAAQRPTVHFVVLGGDNTLYSYENHFLDAKLGPGHGRSFREWVLENEHVDRSRFLMPGLVDYDTFSRYVNDMDLFLYPLQFGSANWGLFELLGRSKIVIASNRCFVPEVITHDVNGLLCDYDNLDEWVRLTLDVLDNLESHRVLGETARRMSVRYRIDRVAAEFVALCERLVRT